MERERKRERERERERREKELLGVDLRVHQDGELLERQRTFLLGELGEREREG